MTKESKTNSLPHDGWLEVNSYNHFEDQEEPEQCEKCFETTFYISVLEHPDLSGDIHVCSRCARIMTRNHNKGCSFQTKDEWVLEKNWKYNGQDNVFRRWDDIVYIVEKNDNGLWQILVRVGIEYFTDHVEYATAEDAISASYELYLFVLKHREENKKNYRGERK